MSKGIANPHTDHVRSVVGDVDAPARSSVAASWRRCVVLHGLDPEAARPPDILTAAQLREAREPLEPLARVGQGVIERLAAAIADFGCCVLLADVHGVPLERRGAASEAPIFDALGLRPGALWSEAHQGTNAIGACVVEERALTIHRDQHFHTRHTELSCTAAPIFDHLGQLAAVLDVSSCRETLAEGLTNLLSLAVIDASRTIEALNFRRAFAGARILLSPHADHRAVSLIAVDRDDLVIGATRSARLDLGVTGARLAEPLRTAALLAGGNEQAELEDAERGPIRRALARANGNVTAAARLLGVSRATLHRKLSRLGLSQGH
ncbi:helix-turn-helix domain-containing protein [Methylocystis bryophila]|uniref:Fis family transcriptional regulator n=1 Tax=Methylocystis bryophila TaxID=655015 RepID=A0A1W6MTE4_9HYPH|nr:helix-turn-helix domain-containing protein [Methylocystis bryophila]ARN80880.1 Fis family transcriptional regulator [Methylocystis bryophila]BDV36762.1 transcriptional regulator [Methylocystis bryophila]